MVRQKFTVKQNNLKKKRSYQTDILIHLTARHSFFLRQQRHNPEYFQLGTAFSNNMFLNTIDEEVVITFSSRVLL